MCPALCECVGDGSLPNFIYDRASDCVYYAFSWISWIEAGIKEMKIRRLDCMRRAPTHPTIHGGESSSSHGRARAEKAVAPTPLIERQNCRKFRVWRSRSGSVHNSRMNFFSLSYVHINFCVCFFLFAFFGTRESCAGELFLRCLVPSLSV